MTTLARICPLLILLVLPAIAQTPTPAPSAPTPAPAAPASAPAAPPPVPAAVPAPVISGRLTPIPFPTDTVDAEHARRAGSDAIEQWIHEFVSRGGAPKRFAVFPLDGDIDDDYFTQQVRNAFANRAQGTDYALYTRDDAMWESLIAEIRLGDRYGDTMAPATIQRFGRVQGIQGVIVGRVSGVYTSAGDVGGNVIQLLGEKRAIQVRISLQAYEVETGKLLWGAERIGTSLLPEDGIVLPGTRRQWLAYGALGVLGLVLFGVILIRLKIRSRPR